MPKVYRLNTYPIIHRGFFHVLVNAIALTPLLERFEVEYGTLTAVALFLGRKSHLLIDTNIQRHQTTH
jgi:membrane associated rhomboid family serine protease